LPQIGVYTVEETEDTADANSVSDLKKILIFKIKITVRSNLKLVCDGHLVSPPASMSDIDFGAIPVPFF
jgi:hypothetical protein